LSIGEASAAFFHFDEDFGFPDEVGEGGAAFGVFDAEFEGCAGFFDAALAEGAEEAVEEDLGFAFFVAFDVLGGPGGEFEEEVLTGFGGVGQGHLWGMLSTKGFSGEGGGRWRRGGGRPLRGSSAWRDTRLRCV